MKRYSVAEARKQMASVLDSAAAGESVYIERRGVRFVVAVQKARALPARRASRIADTDPALLDGQWSWGLSKAGLTYRSRKR